MAKPRWRRGPSGSTLTPSARSPRRRARLRSACRATRSRTCSRSECWRCSPSASRATFARAAAARRARDPRRARAAAHAAALEVVDELVGERRRVIAGGDDDPCTAGDRRRALGQVRRYDQDLESFGKLVEREEAHAYPQTRTRDPLLEAVEDRQLRR